MFYYEVLVASPRYHGDKPLTYSSDQELLVGQLVAVSLQKYEVLGTVFQKVQKPSFAAKSIDKIIDAIIPLELLNLVEWLAIYYPASLGQLMTTLLPTSLKQKSRLPLSAAKGDIKPYSQPTLTTDQIKVVEDITTSSKRMHLLHGETGSGKTRVYIELISKILLNGKSCLLLTPEIGLTPQLTASIEAAYPGQTIVLHSELTPATKRNRWLEVANSKRPLIVIGPRSALFAPLQGIGLIIMDEAHDGAYKQEQAPYYVTSRVAAKLGELHGAKVVLGTATPLIADYYTFAEKNLPIHRLDKLAKVHKNTSSINVINLKDRTQFNESSWVSGAMLEAMKKTLAEGAQSLIFLNRRGTARLVMCQVCGWHALCPRCDISLTYHGDKHQIRCHTCGYSASAPTSCPTCKSTDLTFKSIGTKTLVQEIEKLLPKAKILRFDSDSAKSERIEAQFNSITSGEVDILVGTQILAKGLDLPKLGFVGIINADSGLYFPDFTAEERTYQLISQVIGRAHRGHRDTKVVVQTYDPDNQTLKYAISKNYQGFYEHQLKQRKLFAFPPFRFILKVRVERATAKSAEKTIVELLEKIKGSGLKLELSNPAPAFVEKVHNRYRWQLIIKAVNRPHLLKVIKLLPANVTYDIDPTDLL